MSQQLRVTRLVDFTGATKINVAGGINDLLGGKTYFVRSDGSNGYAGTNPNYPLATITQAVSLCVAENHDYIFVQDYDANDAALFPIVLDKKWSHLIALGNGDPCSGSLAAPSYIIDGAGEAALELTADSTGVEIAGFELGSTGAADPGIDVSEMCWGVHVHHCAFGHLVVANYGIKDSVAGEDFAYGAVDHCFFGPHVYDGGINLANPTRSHLDDNVFRKIKAIGIRSTGDGGTILRNTFSTPPGSTATIGWAIFLGTGGGFMVDGNHAMEWGEATAENPYRDTSGASGQVVLNQWGLNYRGVTATYPAFA